MLPGTRRAINNQINEKYFLRADGKGGVKGGKEGVSAFECTYVLRPLSCVRASGIKEGGSDGFKRGLGLFGEALRGVISSGNCQVARSEEFRNIIRNGYSTRAIFSRFVVMIFLDSRYNSRHSYIILR